MVGVQFEAVGGGAARINEILSGTFVGVDFDEDSKFMQTAPQIQCWDGAKYAYYYYLNDAWFDDNGNDGYKIGWADGYGVFSEDLAPAGSGFWYKTVEDCSVVQSGQVVEGTPAPLVCKSGAFSMVSYPLPMDVCLNDTSKIQFNDVVGVDYDEDSKFMQTASQIQCWDGAKYAYYYYLNDAWFDDNGKDNYKAGWADGYGVLAEDDIPMGRGFWVKPNTTDITITFPELTK